MKKIEYSCRKNLDFNNLTAESFVQMINEDIANMKEDYDLFFSNKFEVSSIEFEIDYDYKPKNFWLFVNNGESFNKDLIRAFETLKSSKNFKFAKGWNFKYDCASNKIGVNIIFDDEYTNKIKKNREEEYIKIRDFYNS